MARCEGQVHRQGDSREAGLEWKRVKKPAKKEPDAQKDEESEKIDKKSCMKELVPMPGASGLQPAGLSSLV